MQFTSNRIADRAEPISPSEHPARPAFEQYVDAIQTAELARQAARAATATERMRAKAVRDTIINNMKLKR